MKISSAKLKQIIKEEIERFLKEQSAVTIDFEGTTTSIEFLGMETKYDQTEVKLRINGEENSFGAYDVDGLADDVIAELGDNDDYWFLGDYPDEPQVSEFKRKLEDALEGMGADPESASETRASYSPENVYELKQIIKEEIESLNDVEEAFDPDASASYEAAMDQLDLVMKGMSVDQVLNVVKDYLEVGDLEMVIRKMPSAEAEEIFDTLRKMSK